MHTPSGAVSAGRRLVAFMIPALLLAGCSSASVTDDLASTQRGAATSPGALPTATRPTASTQSAIASPDSSAPSVAWSETPFEGPVNAVLADGSRFVAVGGESEAHAAWSSADGSSWERHSVPGPSTAHCVPDDPVCIERSAHMGPMLRLHDTVYSFGATEFFNDYIKAIGWRWTDGQDWQVIESENPIYAGGAFRAAAASESDIFAVTHAGYEFTERHWLWAPDTSWQQVGEPISVDNPIEFRSVAWSDDHYVAVGAIWDTGPFPAGEERASEAATWTSSDGRTWTPGTAPPGASTLCSVTATEDGLAVLGVLDAQPTTWVSQGGRDWRTAELPIPDGATAPGACSGNIVAIEGGFLAYVTAGSTTLTWTSTDGAGWNPGDTLDTPTHPYSVAAIGPTIVLFGASTSHVLFVGTAAPGS